MYRLRRGLSLSFFLVLFSASAVFAQEKATIVGTVTDPSGSVIPTAKVTVTNDGTGQVREIQTNSSGSFLVPDLSIGKYSLRAEASGFKTYHTTGITLNVGDTDRVDITMQVGQASETVTVEATAVTVQSDSSDLSQALLPK